MLIKQLKLNKYFLHSMELKRKLISVIYAILAIVVFIEFSSYIKFVLNFNNFSGNN